jgi:DNA-binding NarL/FixJ family response regulator
MSPREQLSSKEIKVATLVWQGQTNPEIAAVLGTTEQVIKNHLRNVFDKLGVWSRLELALYVASHGGARWAELVMSHEPPLAMAATASLRASSH